MAGKKGRLHKKESLYRMLVRTVYEVTEDDTCWVWEGAIGKDGYGFVRNPEKGYMDGVHIVAWEVRYDRPVKEGLQLDHICRTRACWNPNHLQELTPYENKMMAVHLPKEYCVHGHHIPTTGRTKHGQCKVCARANGARWRAEHRL